MCHSVIHWQSLWGLLDLQSILPLILKNDDYFFSEERQINIVQKIIVHIKNSLNNLEDLEIAVNYLNQAINLLDELFGKNDYEDRLGYVFDKFCIGK